MLALLVAACFVISACGSLGRLRLPPPDPVNGYGITGYVGQSSMVAATNENVTLVDARSKVQVATATTDFLGRFKIYPLQPGEYVLLVGNKQMPITITKDHVRMDVNLTSETGEMEYGEGEVGTAEAVASAPETAPAAGPASPSPTTPTGPTPTGQGGAAAIRGCFASKTSMIMSQYWFDGQGRFKKINWNPESGTFTYTGRYQFDGHKLVLAFDGDETQVFDVLKLNAEGIQWGDATGSWTYIRNGDVCP